MTTNIRLKYHGICGKSFKPSESAAYTYFGFIKARDPAKYLIRAEDFRGFGEVTD